MMRNIGSTPSARQGADVPLWWPPPQDPEHSGHQAADAHGRDRIMRCAEADNGNQRDELDTDDGLDDKAPPRDQRW